MDEIVLLAMLLLGGLTLFLAMPFACYLAIRRVERDQSHTLGVIEREIARLRTAVDKLSTPVSPAAPVAAEKPVAEKKPVDTSVVLDSMAPAPPRPVPPEFVTPQPVAPPPRPQLQSHLAPAAATTKPYSSSPATHPQPFRNRGQGNAAKNLELDHRRRRARARRRLDGVRRRQPVAVADRHLDPRRRRRLLPQVFDRKRPARSARRASCSRRSPGSRCWSSARSSSDASTTSWARG